MSSFFNTGKIDDIIHFWSAKQGFQRSNRYRVLIRRNDGQQLEAAAISVQTPSKNIEFIEDTTMGPSSPSIKVPIRNYFDDRFIVTFVVDSKWEVRRFIEDWMDAYFPSRLANGSRGGSTVSPFRTALGTIILMPLTPAHEGLAVNNMTFYDVYPKSILPGEMASAAMDLPLNMIVDFNYRYYKMG